MEMLVLLLADRVVRVTGLLIWQVTWEPGERLQCDSALVIRTFLTFLTVVRIKKSVRFQRSMCVRSFFKVLITVYSTLYAFCNLTQVEYFIKQNH